MAGSFTYINVVYEFHLQNKWAGGIEECAVLGLPDKEWGEKAALSFMPKQGKTIRFDDVFEGSFIILQGSQAVYSRQQNVAKSGSLRFLNGSLKRVL